MNKALAMKQVREYLAMFLRKNKKTKRAAGKGSAILYGAVMLYAVGVFIWLFYQMADALCGALTGAGYSWLYFAMMGMMATALAVYGCIFSVQSAVYQAKDNDLLLAMPIPPGKIVAMRLLACYATVVLMELLVMIPTEAAYIKAQGFSALQALLFLLTIILLPLLALAVSCVLGWLLALCSRHVRDKNLFNVLISVLFLIVFFLVYFRANTYLQQILLNLDAISGKMRIFVYPLYKMGQGLAGTLPAFLLFALLAAGFFLLVYLLLQKTFLQFATAPSGTKKKVYRGGPMKQRSAAGALMNRELLHFRGSSTYILNSSMGTFFMLFGTVFLLIKMDWVREETGWLIEMYPEAAALVAGAGLLFMTGSNELTAPSISLEGRTIWILQSMPVDPFRVFMSKIKLHLLMTLPPAALCLAILFALIRPPAALTLLIALIVALNVLFDAIFGILINLRFPNLQWNDETVALKQSGAAIFSLFGNWALLFVMVILYFPIGMTLGTYVYLAVLSVLITAVCAGLLVLLKKKGAPKFATL